VPPPGGGRGPDGSPGRGGGGNPGVARLARVAQQSTVHCPPPRAAPTVMIGRFEQAAAGMRPGDAPITSAPPTGSLARHVRRRDHTLDWATC